MTRFGLTAFSRACFSAAAVLTGWGAGVDARAQAPVIAEQPRAFAVGPGDRAGFAVTVSGAAPLTYQWFHGVAPIEGATNDVLLWPNAQAGDAGEYTVKVNNAQGTVLSASVRLEVSPYMMARVDLTYDASAWVGDGPALLLPDGRALVAMSGTLILFRPDGGQDPSFASPVFTANPGESAHVTSLRMQDDGRILTIAAVVFQTHVDSFTSYRFRRLNADGSLDSAFSPPAGQIAPAVLLFAGGKILVALDGKLARLNQDGAREPGFSAAVIRSPAGDELAVACATLDGGGRIWVAGGGYVWRLSADGSRDASLPLVALDGEATGISVQDDGRFWVGSKTTAPAADGSLRDTFHLRRFLASGASDPDFRRFDVPLDRGAAAFAVQKDGRVLVGGAFEVRRPTDEPGRDVVRDGIVRLLADGSVDPSFAFAGSAVLGTAIGFVWPDGEYALINNGGQIQRINLKAFGPIEPPRILRVTPGAAQLTAGQDLAVRVIAVGAGPLRIRGGEYSTVSGEALSLPDVQGPLQVVVDGPGGRATRAIATDVSPSAPAFVEAPAPLVARPGQSAIFWAVVRGSRPLTGQWFKDGVALTEPLELRPWRLGTVPSPALGDPSAGSGTYTLRVGNALGTAERSTTLTSGPSSELANLSVRARAGTGDEVMIIGVIVKHPKYVLFQAIGPELAGYGVDDRLTDPTATLHQADDSAMTNDNGGAFWPWNDPLYSAVGATPLAAPESQSAELRTTLGRGAATVVVSGVGGTSGVVLGQLFDAEQTTDRLLNFSARVRAGRDSATAIVGFIIRGNISKRVLVRGVGPGLAAAGVTDAMPDPRLTLVDQASHAALLTNDDWETGTDAAELRRVATAVGAFPLAAGSKDAAMLVTLAPGAYTALVAGAEAREGIVLLEIYDAP